MDRRAKVILTVSTLLVAANLIVWAAVFVLRSETKLKVVFFDVGQGAAVFIETPDKAQILIDGGPSKKILEKLGRELPFFDRRIDLIISTHPDFDHLAGLVEVLKSYQVDAIGSTGLVGQTAEFGEFAAEAEKEQADQIILKRGERLRVGSNLIIDVLAPLEDWAGRETKDTNSASLVLKLSYGQDSFLLTGDAPASVEKGLIEKDENSLDVEVLQVAHHGSKSSSSEAWLKAVSPELAVIQVGQNNRYGHPDPVILERLQNYAMKVMRTDEVGDIKIMSDGQNYAVSPF